jgi:hypothetical protein
MGAVLDAARHVKQSGFPKQNLIENLTKANANTSTRYFPRVQFIPST